MLKQKIMPTVVLGSICLVVALLLSVVNMFTGPVIEAAQNAAANEALLEVLPDGKNFEELVIDESYPSVINMGYKAEGGFVFRASVTGKSSGLVIMCGISTDGKIVGTKVIAEQETDSYDANVFPFVEGLDGKYKDMSGADFEPYLVSGATLTSRAFSEAMKASLDAYIVANGGTVELRTPEQILQDNCNAALGTEGAVFEKWFATAPIEGVDALYISDKGAVAVIGEVFVGIADGAAVGDIGEAEKTAALAAYDAYKGEKLTEVAKPEGAHKNVAKMYTTENGVVVIEMKAAGYGINGDWHTSGEYITFKVAIDGEGKIISTLTTYQSESKDIGDVVAKPDYYEQYNGKTAETYADVATVSGATVSTKGYKDAIKQAFEAYELLKGGNEQ